MFYFVYLDEFGHIGPYLAADDPRHNTHPAFGLGGLILPYQEVRSFSTYFFQLKNHLLEFELTQSGAHPAKWEKKGSSLYTLQNVQTYPQLRKATFRLINNIKQRNGFIFYVGLEKHRNAEQHDAKKLYHSVLKEAIKRINQECESRGAQFLVMLDQQEGNVMRGEIVEQASMAMFGNEQRKCLVEPPIQAESHLYQTLQCADWICGLMGRLSHYWCEPNNKPGFADFQKYFSNRIQEAQLRSGLRRLS